MAQGENIPTAWLLLSVEGRRQYGGNTGYDDIPGRVYRFDSFVPNARHIKPEDIAVFRDRSGGTGLAKVISICSSEGTKELLRCPDCNVAQIKERITIQPRFRCKNRHEFEHPLREERACTKYEAQFGDTHISADPPIPIELLRNACHKFNGQLSIQEISLVPLAQALERYAPDAVTMIGLHQWRLQSTDALLTSTADNGIESADGDSRKEIFRQIRARRGQKKFRDMLLRRCNEKCQISGCGLVDVLEAAHINPYRFMEDNQPENGLLLRCDLHTLFDVDLIGIEPDSLIVRVSDIAAKWGYAKYDGLTLECPQGRPSKSALHVRWEYYCARLTKEDFTFRQK